MPKVRVRGTCKLCLYEKDLCDSHYLPKGMYRFARAPELKNPNPVMNVDGRLTQISDQFRDYVFCSDCEGLLNDNGERWVQAKVPSSYGSEFPLQNRIKQLQPAYSQQNLEVYDVSRERAFDMQKLVYFGISVFWRGSVHHWTTSAEQRAPEVRLGALQEPLRKFLLGEGSLPQGTVLLLDVWPFEDSKTIPGIWAPRPGDAPECQVYWFCVPGLIYRLFIGDNIPLNVRRLNAARGFISVDRQLGLDIINYTKTGLESLSKGPKIEEMFENISNLRRLRNRELAK